MYTGNLELSVNTAQDMLAGGSLLQLGSVVEAAAEYIAERINYSNCLGIEHFANLHSCESLERDARTCAVEHFEQLSDGVEFLQLSADRLVSYLTLDEIDVSSEDQLLEIAMRWLRHDPATRSELSCRVLQCVRLPLLSEKALQQILKDPLISSSEACTIWVEEAIKLKQKTSESSDASPSAMPTPRKWTVPRETLVAIGGFSKTHDASELVMACDVTRGRWRPLEPLPSTVSWFSAVAFRNDIFVMGGLVFSQNKIVDTVFRFCASELRWVKTSPLVVARARHASAATKDTIYVIGGMHLSEDGKLRSVEAIEGYNPETDSWCVFGKVPFPRKQASVVALGAMLMEVGGTRYDNLVEGIMDMYTLSEGTVEHTGEHFRLPSDLQFSQLVCLDGIFYILWEKERYFLRLDPVRRTSRVLAKPKLEHTHSGAAIVDGKVYIAGGLHDSRPTEVVECYDPVANSWSSAASMPKERACLVCVKIVI